MSFKNISIEIETDDGTIKFSAPLATSAPERGLVLTSYNEGAQINVIKVIRAFTGKPLKEAKEVSENLPFVFAVSDLKGVDAGIGLRCFANDLGAAGGLTEAATSRNSSASLIRDILALFTEAANS